MELENQESPTLLIDARNCAYRAAYAYQRSANSGNTKYHPVVIYIKQIAEIILELQASSVNFFWDAPRDTVWRKKIYPVYKNRDNNVYVQELGDIIKQIEAATRLLLPYLNVRQFAKERMETDDLIYSACRVLFPRPCVIVSSDSDFQQVAFRMRNVKLYDPQGKQFAKFDTKNDPACLKALIGDKSDRIDGYRGIGEKKGPPILESFEKRKEFLSQNDPMIFVKNLMLVDLSYNPWLLQNDYYVATQMADKPVYNAGMIKQLASDNGYSGMDSILDKLYMPFKRMLEKDKKPDAKVDKSESDLETLSNET